MFVFCSYTLDEHAVRCRGIIMPFVGVWYECRFTKNVLFLFYMFTSCIFYVVSRPLPFCAVSFAVRSRGGVDCLGGGVVRVYPRCFMLGKNVEDCLSD